MSTKEIIEELCAKKGITIAKLERELDLSNGSIGKADSMKSDRLLLISKYFGVTMEYLMGESTEKEGYYFNDDAKEYAQFLFDNPGYRVLFDATRNVKAEDLQKAVELLKILGKED